MEESSQILVFVSTRRFTESLAGFVSGKIKKVIPAERKNVFKEVAEKILDVPRRRVPGQPAYALNWLNA